MAYEINDLKRILTLVLFAIPMIASKNIDCSGRAFHCVNSTHFMICVDLGGGLSTTIDDFVIPCPATTVCHINNVFECDFPDVEVTTPPLQVIDIYKQSDTSETTSVTTSVTAPTPPSEILSVFKENITATNLPIPEDVTPVFKLEVLEDIRGNSDNSTETNIQVNSSFIDTTNEIINDKQTSNKTITTSATDNNKNLESAVEPSINKAVNTSLTDKTKSIDTVTSVIGLINLISIDHSTVVSTKPSSDVLTSLDTLYDNIATTTEQYNTKQVIIQGENVNENIHNQTIQTDIFGERSVIRDEVSPTPMINIFIDKDINNSIKNINKIDSDNQTIVKRDSPDKSNTIIELVPETTTEYFAEVKIDNISEPVAEVASPQTTTDKTIVPLKIVDLIPVGFYEEKVPSTKLSPDYLNKLNDNTATTILQKTTLSDISVTTEAISTSPILKTNIQNVNKSDTDNDFFNELNSTVEITTTENVPKINTTYFTPEPVTVASLQTNTEKTPIPRGKETNILYTRETTPTSGDLSDNHSLVKKHTTAIQPLEVIITTDSSIKITDDLYQFNRELNQTLISTKNNIADTPYTTETSKIEYNASTKDIIHDKSTDPTSLLPTTIQYSAIKTATTEAIQNEFTAYAKEVLNKLPEINGLSVSEPSTTNVKNDTLLNNTTNLTANNTEDVETVFNALRTDINNNKGTEPTLFLPTTIKYPANEISPTETKQNAFTVRLAEATSEFPATNTPFSVYEPHIDNNGTNTLLHVQPTPYKVTSDAVRNTTVKDLTSESDIVTNAQIFTPDTIELTASDGYTSIDQATTQKVTNNPETKIPDTLNHPENLGPNSLQENLNTTTIADQDLVTMSTTDFNNFENSATTPFPDHVTENNIKVDITAAINKVTSQDVLPKTNYYVTELTSTTPNTAQSISTSMDTKTLQQVSTPELDSIYSVSTTDDKTESSTTFTVDLADTTNIVNVRDLPITILPTQELLIQKNVTVNQLNTTSTTTETIRDLLPDNVTTARYAVLYTEDLDLNTKHSKDSEPIIYKVDANADVNKNVTINPINGKYTDTSISPADHTNKDENFTIVPVFDIINSSVNAMPNGTMQLSSPYLSLTNDYVKTTQSQDSSVYVPVTDNIPDYNSVQVGKLVTQETPTLIVSSTETKVMNSALATPSTHTLPRIEIVTENVKYVSTEAPISSTEVHEHIDPTTTAVNFVADTNEQTLSTEAILTQINKVHKVKTDSSSSSVGSLMPYTAASLNGLVVPDNNKITTITDGAFTMSSTQMPPKVAVDEDNIKITTEYPLSKSKVIETKSALYNTEPSLPISRVSVEQVIMTTEPTATTNTLFQTLPSLATIGKTNQDVTSGIKPTDLPQNVLSAVNNNIPQLTPALHTGEVTVAQITSEPSPTPYTSAQTVPSLATIGKTNPDMLSGIKTTDFPQNVLSAVKTNVTPATPTLHIADVTDAQVTSEPIPITNIVTRTTPSLATIGETNQDVQPEMKITDLPQNVLSAVNNKIPQAEPALHVTEVSGAHITSKPTPTTNTFTQTTPSIATISETTNVDVSVVNNNLPQLTPAPHTAGVTGAQVASEPIPTANKFAQTPPSLATNSETNPDAVPGMKTTDPSQNVFSIISNDIPQPTPALDVAGATATKFTAAPTPTTYKVAQITPLLATIRKTNQDVVAGMKSTDLPQNVLSKVKNNIPQSTPTVYTVGVTDAQITSESTPITNTFSQIAIGKTNHDVPTGIKTTTLPQNGILTVNNYNPVVSDITTKTIIDSLSVPDLMAETIKVDGNKVSGTPLGETISSDVMSSNPTVPPNSSVKIVKNIIDHESIVIGNTSKNNSQNTTTTKSVDINKVEIVNHTESDWMRPDVNIDGVQIKESETEEAETSKPVIKSVKDPQIKTLPADSTKTAQIKPIDVKTVHIVDSKITKMTPSPAYVSESMAPRNYTQSKTVIIKDNKKMGNDSSVNKNVYQIQADSKNVTDGYKLSNTKPNITTSYNNLSQHNSTINDELEQHLLSGNHTITAEIQSHLNESGKQSNKTNDELPLNVTSTHNSNPSTLKLNEASKNKSAIAIPASVFNCSNRTRGKYADNKDCRKFYTCIGNLQPMLGTCPNNTVFSEINKQCTKNLSHCVRNNQFHCLFEGRFSDFFKDNIYYICVKNRIHGFIRYKLQCQTDYHLNKESVKCEKNEELSTQSVSSVSETNTDESKPESKSEKIISADNYECKKEGNFPYVKDCSKYYVCTKIKNVYRRKIKKCASDEVFDKKEKKCVESDSGEC